MPAATDEAPASTIPPVRAPVGRAVIWLGLAAGTAVTVLAVMHGIRVPGLQVVLAVVVTWLLLVAVAVTVTELLRRHHRAMAGHAWRHGKRGALFAGRRARRRAGSAGGYLARWAAVRWQNRTGKPTPGDAPGDPFTPVLLTARSKSGQVLNPVTGEPVATVLVKDPDDLKRRLAAAARYPDIEVTVRPAEVPGSPSTRRADGKPETGADKRFFDLRESGYTGPIDQDGNPPEGKTNMTDTHVVGDTTEPAKPRSRRGGRLSGTAYSAPWNPAIAATADFEPEDDGHLLAWMAGEVAGMSAYAEGLTEVYETCVNTVGLDPVAMQATHDVADAAAEAASAMATARAKFAAHYSEVREFAANGGLLPFNGRWVTGDGDA